MAGITISAITGNESAMQKAQQAKQETDAANELEEIKLAVVSAMVNGTDGKVSAENLRTALTGIIDNTSGITGNGPWTVTGKSGTNYKIDSYGQVEKLTSQSTSNLEPGIYDENNQIVWTWDEFLEIGLWNVDSNGVLSLDTTLIDNGTMTEEEALGELSRIKKVVIPDEVTSIGEMAFTQCTSLSSIEIPSGVTSIDSGAFYGCTSLSSIEIPSSVTSIGNSTFAYCTSLSSIEIPSGVTSIGEEAFYECASLSSIEIPSSVTSIGYMAFYDCISLSSIEIPSSVTSIGNCAFMECTSLSSIEIPSSVTSIGKDAFAYCTSLSSINVNESNANYASVDGILFNKNKTELLYYPEGKTATSYSIPNSVTSIGGGAFANCTNLSSIEIPSSVTSIGEEAFYECTSLSSIEIPSSVTSIGDGAFARCTYLSSITIHKNKGEISPDNLGLPDGTKIHWDDQDETWTGGDTQVETGQG